MTGMHVSISKADHRRVWTLAGPMILTGISTPLLGMVDTAVMGHLPDPQFLGAVAVGAMIVQFVFWAFGFLRMGTTGFAAQAHGAGDGDEIRAVLGRSLLLAAVISGVLVLLQAPIAWIAFSVVDASNEVEQEARLYYAIRIWGAPAALANYALWGWFLGMQDARFPLALMLTINGLNIVLDLFLVVGLGMRTEGVALASLVSEFAGLVVGLLLISRAVRGHPGRWRRQLILDGRRLRHMLRVNHNILLRTLGLMFAFAFFTAQSARFGDIVLAANAVLMNFMTFAAYGLDGFAHAAEALTGTAIGSGKREAFRRAVKAAGLWAVACAALFSVVYLLAGKGLIGLLTNLTEVRAVAADYLPWLIAAPFISVWAFLFDGIFIGATRAKEMRNAMLIAVLLIYLPAWYVLLPFGNHGLWLALILFMGARGATLGWIFRQIERREGFVRSD